MKPQLDTDYNDKRLYMVSMSPSGKDQDNTSSQTTSTSIYIHSNSSFTDFAPQSQLLTAPSNYKYRNKK